MPQPPQTLRNHTRLHPPFHFFVLPVFGLNIFAAIYVTVHRWPEHRALCLWWILLSVAMSFHALFTRMYATKNQDRIIRLEERLRLASLLPSADHALINQLSSCDLIALRFASDAELPALARRTLEQHLTPKQIKEAITTWRPDHFRV